MILDGARAGVSACRFNRREVDKDVLPSRKPSECTLGGKRSNNTRERDRDHEVEKPTRRSGKRHANVTNV